MVIRGLVAASCVVLAVAAPAQAGATDDCTTDLVRSLFSAPGDPQYPIVEQTPEGSIIVHPQNIEPAIGETVNGTLDGLGSTVVAIETWVDCVV